jgi:alpha-L-fucosidase
MEEYERPRGPYISEWIMWVAKIPREEYKQLVNQFNPVKFNADEWVRIARDAGMKYILITTKHADGFALWDSDVTDYDIGSTPFDHDVLAELNQACKKYGLKLCLYYCQNADWMNVGDCNYSFYKDYTEGVRPQNSFHWAGQQVTDWGANLYDPSPNTFDEYLVNKAYPQVAELLTRYNDLGVLWYDFPMWQTRSQSFAFYQLAYKHQPGTLVCSRVGHDYGDYIVSGDNYIPDENEKWNKQWECVGTLNNSWGYKSYDTHWKSAYEILFWIIDIASKGGNYTLNVGPRADGTIP